MDDRPPGPQANKPIPRSAWGLAIPRRTRSCNGWARIPERDPRMRTSTANAIRERQPRTQSLNLNMHDARTVSRGWRSRPARTLRASGLTPGTRSRLPAPTAVTNPAREGHDLQPTTHYSHSPHHGLHAYLVAVELLLAVREAAPADAKLREHALKSAKSVCLNVAEAAGRTGPRRQSPRVWHRTRRSRRSRSRHRDRRALWRRRSADP